MKIHLYTNFDGFLSLAKGKSCFAWTKGLAKDKNIHIEVPIDRVFYSENNPDGFIFKVLGGGENEGSK